MKIRGTIKGQTIELDSPSGLPTDQRVEIEVRPVQDGAEADDEKLNLPDSVKGRRRITRFSDLGISVEELEARIATEPQFEFIRQADEHRKKLEKLRGGKLNLTTQWIREDRDR